MSHGATMHWILSVALSRRQKFIYNASLEPEITHLLGILRKMGAEVRGSGTMAIMNMGRADCGLLRGGVFEVMPDRMETGTYALLALALREKIHLHGTNADNCRPWMNLVREIIKPETDRIRIEADSMRFNFKDFEFPGQHIVVSPFPGKETDLQQIWTAALTTAKTESIIVDPMYYKRSDMPDMHPLFNNMEYSQVEIEDFEIPKAGILKIFPGAPTPAVVNGFDLRGTMALIVLAALATGESRINNPSPALRGYPNLVQNLQNMGIDVTASEEGTELESLPEF